MLLDPFSIHCYPSNSKILSKFKLKKVKRDFASYFGRNPVEPNSRFKIRKQQLEYKISKNSEKSS